MPPAHDLSSLFYRSRHRTSSVSSLHRYHRGTRVLRIAQRRLPRYRNPGPVLLQLAVLRQGQSYRGKTDKTCEHVSREAAPWASHWTRQRKSLAPSAPVAGSCEEANCAVPAIAVRVRVR
jgi:hypothetical protein